MDKKSSKSITPFLLPKIPKKSSGKKILFIYLLFILKTIIIDGIIYETSHNLIN